MSSRVRNSKEEGVRCDWPARSNRTRGARPAPLLSARGALASAARGGVWLGWGSAGPKRKPTASFVEILALRNDVPHRFAWVLGQGARMERQAALDCWRQKRGGRVLSARQGVLSRNTLRQSILVAPEQAHHLPSPEEAPPMVAEDQLHAHPVSMSPGRTLAQANVRLLHLL